MAEYKGKLLKGLFTQAKNVLYNNGDSVEKSSLKSDTFSGTTTSQGQIQLYADGTDRILIAVNFDSYASDFKYGTIAQYGQYGVLTCFNTNNGVYANKTIGGTYYYRDL